METYQKIQLNGHPALQNSEGKIALLPEGHRLLETMRGIIGATDDFGRELELQFYERAPDDLIARESREFPRML